MTERSDPDTARRRIRRVLERFAEGETEVEEIDDPSGVPLRLERDPDDPRRYVMSIRGTADEWVPQVEGVRFPPTDGPPADWPGDFPFLPGATAVLNLHLGSGARSLRWEALPDGVGARSWLMSELRAEGWERATDPGPPRHHPDEILLRRSGLERRILLGEVEDGAELVVVEEGEEG